MPEQDSKPEADRPRVSVDEVIAVALASLAFAASASLFAVALGVAGWLLFR